MFHSPAVGVEADKPCSQIYPGTHPFSEPEALSLARYMYSIRNRIKVYIDFHAYGQLVLSPWGYTTNYPPTYSANVRQETRVIRFTIIIIIIIIVVVVIIIIILRILITCRHDSLTLLAAHPPYRKVKKSLNMTDLQPLLKINITYKKILMNRFTQTQGGEKNNGEYLTHNDILLKIQS